MPLSDLEPFVESVGLDRLRERADATRLLIRRDRGETVDLTERQRALTGEPEPPQPEPTSDEPEVDPEETTFQNAKRLVLSVGAGGVAIVPARITQSIEDLDAYYKSFAPEGHGYGPPPLVEMLFGWYTGTQPTADRTTTGMSIERWIERQLGAPRNEVERAAREIVSFLSFGATLVRALRTVQSTTGIGVAGGTADFLVTNTNDPSVIETVDALAPEIRETFRRYVRAEDVDDTSEEKDLEVAMRRRVHAIGEGAFGGIALEKIIRGSMRIFRLLKQSAKATDGNFSRALSKLDEAAPPLGRRGEGLRQTPAPTGQALTREQTFTPPPLQPDPLSPRGLAETRVQRTEVERMFGGAEATTPAPPLRTIPTPIDETVEPFAQQAVRETLEGVPTSSVQVRLPQGEFVFRLPHIGPLTDVQEELLRRQIQQTTDRFDPTLVQRLVPAIAGVVGAGLALTPENVEAQIDDPTIAAGLSKELVKTGIERFGPLLKRFFRRQRVQRAEPPERETTEQLAEDVVGTERGIRTEQGFIPITDALTSPDIDGSDLVRIAESWPEDTAFGDAIARARNLGTTNRETFTAARMFGFGDDTERFLSFMSGQNEMSRMVAKARLAIPESARQVKQFAREYLDDPTTVNPQKFLRQFTVHADLLRAFAGLRAEVGRSLNMFRGEITEGDITVLKSLQKNIFASKTKLGIDPLVVAKWLVDAPDDQLTMLARKSTDPTFGGAIRELFINSILASPKPMVANFVGNAGAITLLDIPKRFWSVAASKAFGGDIRMDEAFALLTGYVNAIPEAYAAFGRVMRGIDPALNVKFETGNFTPQITAKTPGIQGTILEPWADQLGKAVRTPTTILAATDVAFKHLVSTAELKALAVRASRGEPDPEAFIRNFVADPPSWALDKARNKADVMTFVNSLSNPEGASFQFIRDVGASIQGLQVKYPMMKLFIPFIRTPVNLATFALDNMPATQLLTRRFWSAIRGDDPNERALAIGQLMNSIAIGTAFTGMAYAGTLTGLGSSNRTLRKRQMDAGFQPTAVVIGDKSFTIDRADPIGFIASVYGRLGELMNGAHADDRLDQIVTGVTTAFAQIFARKSYVQGLARIMDAFSTGVVPQDSIDVSGKIVMSTLAGFTPAFVRELNKLVDPHRKEINDALDVLAAQTPGISSTVPVQRDVFEKPLLYTHGFGGGFLSNVFNIIAPTQIRDLDKTLTPGRKALVENRVSIDKPSRFMSVPAGRRVVNVKLDDRQYDFYRETIRKTINPITGDDLEQAIDKLVQSSAFKQLDKRFGGENLREYKERIIRKVFGIYRTLAKQTLFTSDDPVAQSIRRSATEELEKRTR